MNNNEVYIGEANEVFQDLSTLIKKEKFHMILKEIFFKALSTISYDASFVGTDITKLNREIRDLSMESTVDTTAERNLCINGAYTTYRIKYPEVKNIAHNDLIWLHFSLTETGAINAFKEIQKVLTDRKISYHLKIARHLGPDLIVLGLYNKKDARKVLDICADNPRVQEAIMHNNPFMPHENGIGITKEIEGRSYTHHLSDLLYNYTKGIEIKYKKTNQYDENWFTFIDFLKYVTEEFNNNKEKLSIFDRYLNYQVALGLNCIYTGSSYLDSVEHLKPLEYDKDIYSKYKMSYENREIIYIDQDGNTISEGSNYLLWLKLQSHCCLQRMYFEKHNEIPKEDEQISANLSGYISNITNCIMSGRPYYGTIGYKDDLIKHLLPYLVAYNGYLNKMATIEETKFIVSELRKRTITKTEVSNDKRNFYTVGGEMIQSSIPPIRIIGQLIGIEYIDYELNYCNVSILKEGKIKRLLGVFIDADKERLWGEKLPGASLYRAILGQILSSENIPSEKTIRGGHAGELLQIEEIMKQLSDISLENEKDVIR